MREYDWSKKTPTQKNVTYIFQGIFFILFIPFFLAGAMHIHEISWSAFGQIVSGFFILALFPLIVFPVIFALRENNPPMWKHTFFREWASAYSGKGKGGGGIRFFFEDILQFEFTRAYLKNKPFYLTTINFRPTLNNFGKGHQVRIGIGASNDEALKPLLEWAQMHGIETKIDQADPSTSSG